MPEGMSTEIHSSQQVWTHCASLACSQTHPCPNLGFPIYTHLLYRRRPQPPWGWRRASLTSGWKPRGSKMDPAKQLLWTSPQESTERGPRPQEGGPGGAAHLSPQKWEGNQDFRAKLEKPVLESTPCQVLPVDQSRALRGLAGAPCSSAARSPTGSPGGPRGAAPAPSCPGWCPLCSSLGPELLLVCLFAAPPRKGREKQEKAWPEGGREGGGLFDSQLPGCSPKLLRRPRHCPHPEPKSENQAEGEPMGEGAPTSSLHAAPSSAATTPLNPTPPPSLTAHAQVSSNGSTLARAPWGCQVQRGGYPHPHACLLRTPLWVLPVYTEYPQQTLCRSLGDNGLGVFSGVFWRETLWPGRQC